MDKLSYALGHNIGHQLIGMGLQKSLNIEDYAAAIADVLQGREPKMSHQEVQQVLEHYFTELEQRQQAEAAERGKAAKGEGEAFLAENKKRAGVVTTPSGLQYEIVKEGTGRQPKASDTVRCHYEGTLIDGTVFDSSYRRNQPAEFGLRQVIAGWTEGVQLMKEGSIFKFYIPYNLAYGERGAGADIPPYAALIFTVELIKVL
ncbi:MAG: FKBP-type peptidyl-prolyl cis-trans isomerase [Bacteroidales bacterium]|jgi:FKBP-type peptidyl-prolyl cis-trans isomerase FklB|nr:FKBP-type peptidyl-prolyl cis-trans isomerase [Bacteroidales bacterium]